MVISVLSSTNSPNTAYTSQDIVINNMSPVTYKKSNDSSIKNISSLEKSTDESKEFSHNRYIARQAYLGQGSNSEDRTDEITKGSKDNETVKAQNTDAKIKNSGCRDEYTEAEQKMIEDLKKEDSDTKAHERAHQSAGGQYAGSPSYDYERGPDGKDYAIGGHVNIDVSEESTPEKTLQKMQRVIQAAKAPADPSSQDLKVATEASQKAAQARQEIAQQSVKKNKNSENDNNSESNKTNGIEHTENRDQLAE